MNAGGPWTSAAGTAAWSSYMRAGQRPEISQPGAAGAKQRQPADRLPEGRAKRGNRGTSAAPGNIAKYAGSPERGDTGVQVTGGVRCAAGGLSRPVGARDSFARQPRAALVPSLTPGWLVLPLWGTRSIETQGCGARSSRTTFRFRVVKCAPSIGRADRKAVMLTAVPKPSAVMLRCRPVKAAGSGLLQVLQLSVGRVRYGFDGSSGASLSVFAPALSNSSTFFCHSAALSGFSQAS